MATRTAKLLPHLLKRPQDIIHVPAFILFGYYFAIMKLYALFTLHEVRFPLMSPRLFLTFTCRSVGEPVLVSVMLLLPSMPSTIKEGLSLRVDFPLVVVGVVGRRMRRRNRRVMDTINNSR